MRVVGKNEDCSITALGYCRLAYTWAPNTFYASFISRREYRLSKFAEYSFVSISNAKQRRHMPYMGYESKQKLEFNMETK